MFPRIVLFCGGVGGARMANGFAAAMAPQDLQIAVNVGDDFVFCGLNVSPDLDTVMYTLAGLNDTQRGWGFRDETWIASRRTAQLGGPAWFQLGDRDLATHLTRTAQLAEGKSLSAVTASLCSAVGIQHSIVPVSDQPIRTRIRTADTLLDFQDYFVRQKAEPVASQILYSGASEANLVNAVRLALDNTHLQAVIIAPSNPWLSIGPMLAIPELKTTLQRLRARTPVIAISPIIAGQAIKGPAAKLLGELGHEVSAFGVAEYYKGLITHLVIDNGDAHLAERIRGLGMQVHCTDILIPTPAEQTRLAQQLLALVSSTATA